MRTLLRGFLRPLKRNETVRWLYFTLLGSYRRQWDSWAGDPSQAMHAIAPGTSSATFGPSGVEVADRLRLYVRPDDRVLDVGCGMGRVMRPLAPYCREISGIDVSPRMVKLAREFLRGVPNASVHHTNGVDLSLFASSTFEVAYVVYVLQHLEREHAVRYVCEMSRLLVPGGTLICEVPNLAFPRNLETYVRTARGAKHFSVARTRFYTSEEVNAILTGVGLTLIDMKVGSEIFVVARNTTESPGRNANSTD